MLLTAPQQGPNRSLPRVDVVLAAGGLRHGHDPNLQAHANVQTVSQFQLNDFQFIGGVTGYTLRMKFLLGHTLRLCLPEKTEHAQVGSEKEKPTDHSLSFAL